MFFDPWILLPLAYIAGIGLWIGSRLGVFWGVAGGVVAAATIPLAIKLLAIVVIGFFFYCLLGGVLIAFIWHSIVSR